MKKGIIIGITIGLLASGIVAYAATITADKIQYKEDKTVEGALNELYTKSNGAKTINLKIVDYYQLAYQDGFTYESLDTSIATVNNKGFINSVAKGSTTINVKFNDEIVLKYNVTTSLKPLAILPGASLCFYDTPNVSSTTEQQSNQILTYLTDGITTKQGSYDSILINSSKYIYFNVSEDMIISFSSGYYSDSGGRTGATALFYKIDDSNKETLYYSLPTKGNTVNYGEHEFTKGRYVVRGNGSYVNFSEWHITLK